MCAAAYEDTVSDYEIQQELLTCLGLNSINHKKSIPPTRNLTYYYQYTVSNNVFTTRNLPLFKSTGFYKLAKETMSDKKELQ